jgi:hypothetical protein
MSKVIAQTKKQKDIKRIEQLMKAWASLKKDKAEHDLTVAPIIASIKEAEAEMIELAKLYPDQFKDKNWVFEDGYIHISDVTKVSVNEKKFSWSKFMNEFPQLVALKDFDHKEFSKNFKLKELKKLFTGGDTRKSLVKHTIELDFKEEYEVKQPKGSDTEENL